MSPKTLCLLAVLVWNVPVRAQVGLAVAPMRSEIRINPGQEYTDTIRVSNDSPAAGRVRAESLDWFIDSVMVPQFADNFPQEEKFSCREWLDVNPRETELEAAATTRARYTVRVPPDTPEGEYHCGLGFVTLPPANRLDSDMGVHIAVRAVSALYVIVGSPTSKPILKSLSLAASAESAWTALVTFENKGQRTFRVTGFVDVKDSEGRSIQRFEYAPIPVLPLREQRFVFPLKVALAPGDYVLHTQADVGFPEIFEGSVRVTVNEPR